jgi:hypothetical protein
MALALDFAHQFQINENPVHSVIGDESSQFRRVRYKEETQSSDPINTSCAPH